MNFIKKIVDKNYDYSVHLQFQKFSKGTFKDRAVLRVKKSGEKYTINASAEFANELIRSVAEEVGNSKVKVTGAIVSTSDLKGSLDFSEIKQFQGVKRYLLEKEMSGNEIISLLDKFPKSFFGLTFDSPKSQLKIKAKAPKSGKPGSKGEDTPKPDFCKLVTTNAELGQSFVIETPNFKEANIVHEVVVEAIEVPEELKKSEDFAKIREESKRVGKLIRKAHIDGVEKISELKFSA